MKTHLTLSAVLTLGCLVANAKPNALTVAMKSQESIVFALEESPTYWTSSTTLFIQSPKLYQELALADVEKISFEETNSVVNLISTNETAVYPTVATDVVYISSPTPTNVEITASNGTSVKSSVCDSETPAAINISKINISDLEQGVYLIKVNDRTFKMIKK